MAMKGSYTTGRGGYGKTRGNKRHGASGTVGASTNACARHPRSARSKAVAGRTKKGAVRSRPMEFTYRDIPFNTPRANLTGI